MSFSNDFKKKKRKNCALQKLHGVQKVKTCNRNCKTIKGMLFIYINDVITLQKYSISLIAYVLLHKFMIRSFKVVSELVNSAKRIVS